MAGGEAAAPEAEAMWAAMDPSAAGDCDCPGPPPPEFLLPPPPRPPFLQDHIYCSEDPLPDIETCDALPVSYFIKLNLKTNTQNIIKSVFIVIKISFASS